MSSSKQPAGGSYIDSSMQRSLINSTFSQRWERLQKDWEPLLSFISVSDFEKIVHWPPLFSIQYYARIDFYFVFALVSAAECFWTFKESRGWPGWLVHKVGRQAAAAAGVSPIYNRAKIFFKSHLNFCNFTIVAVTVVTYVIDTTDTPNWSTFCSKTRIVSLFRFQKE